MADNAIFSRFIRTCCDCHSLRSAALGFYKRYHSNSASLFYVAAILSFTLAFGYLWSIVWPREFEHPAKSTLIRDHAQALTEWHISTKNSDEIIDSRVVDDVRIFIIDQLSNATETNRDPTLKRLSARSRTILLLLAGLAFISVSEMLMFVLS